MRQPYGNSIINNRLLVGESLEASYRKGCKEERQKLWILSKETIIFFLLVLIRGLPDDLYVICRDSDASL